MPMSKGDINILDILRLGMVKKGLETIYIILFQLIIRF